MKAPSPNPVLVVDTREQAPLSFAHFATEPGTLYSGDYSLRGAESLFAIEYKGSLEDLVTCLSRERARFERELLRLRGYRFARLLIVGSRAAVEAHSYRSQMLPKAVLASLDAFEARYGVPVVWTATREAAALQIETWAHWFHREVLKAAEACQAKSPS